MRITPYKLTQIYIIKTVVSMEYLDSIFGTGDSWDIDDPRNFSSKYRKKYPDHIIIKTGLTSSKIKKYFNPPPEIVAEYLRCSTHVYQLRLIYSENGLEIRCFDDDVSFSFIGSSYEALMINKILESDILRDL